MRKYSRVFRDPGALSLCIGTSVLIVTPFLSADASDLPFWLNWLLATTFLIVGFIFLYARIRHQLSQIPNTEKARDTADPIDKERTFSAIGRISQESVSTQAQSTLSQNRWEIVEHSLRRAPIVRGEGPVLLMGIAEVDVTGDNEYEKLYYCSMFNATESQFYYEFKVHSPFGKIIERDCEIRTLPENDVAYRRKWPSADAPFNNILCDWESAVDDGWQLVSTCERLLFVWTDKIETGTENVSTSKHRIYVPVEGLKEVSQSLGLNRSNYLFMGGLSI